MVGVVKPRVVALLFATGVFLGQLAWIFAVPPYRGIDEFDHVYRAASVAEGYWKPGVGAPQNGRGELVPVPAAIVTDGAEVCRSYEYVGPDNCRAVDKWQNELVTVASAAARYNPGFYWLIGKPSQFFEGAGAVYAMRITASLFCAALVGLAAWITARWSTTVWPLAGLTLALTPVVVYSFSLPAPNGIEMAGALCVWSSLLGFVQAPDRRTRMAMVGVATLGAVPMVAVRTLGPLWLALTVCVLVQVLGPRRVLSGIRGTPLSVGSAAGVVALAGSLALWWSRSASANALEDAGVGSINPWLRALQEVPLWFFQSMAAFPTRNEPAPTIVYAGGAVAFFAFVGWAALRSSARTRLGMVSTSLLALGVPYALTVATVGVAGTVWQGRYTLPFAFGVVLVAGLGLEQAQASARPAPPLVMILGTAIAAVHAVSVVSVQRLETAGSPLSGDPRWFSAPIWLSGLVAMMGVGCWLLVLLQRLAHAPPMPTHGRQPPYPLIHPRKGCRRALNEPSSIARIRHRRGVQPPSLRVNTGENDPE